MVRRILLCSVLLVACNAEGDAGVRRGHAEGHPDAAVTEEAGVPVAPEEAGAPALESRLAEALASDEFRDAACKVAGVVAHAADPAISCEAVQAGCVGTVGSVDASALGAVPVPDRTLELDDCQVTVAQADACIAELVGVVVSLAEDLGCGLDAGVPALGPELLLSAPSCLIVALTCPALLEGLLSAPMGGAPGAGQAR